MKVVWLCNYSLKYLSDSLKIDIDFSGKHPLPWLYHLVTEISKRRNIELHIITLNKEIDNDSHISENGVYYHLIKEKSIFVPIYKAGRITKKKIQSANILWKNKVLRLINMIDPDIVNVHGTEGALQILGNEVNKPKILWMQGLMNMVIKQQESDKYKFWLENENEIIKHHNYFITFPGDMEGFIKKTNNNAHFFNIYHPNPQYAFDLFDYEITANADLVYVAEIVKRKGIEDFIEIVNILKPKLNVSAKIIGFSGNSEYLGFIQNRINTLQLSENIRFVGYLHEHADVFMEIKKSKLLVLPTYVDTGPRTVAESMTVGTPVISYNIDGLPEMISNDFSGMLVDCGNVNELASITYDLLIDEKKRKYLSQNAYKTAVIKYSPAKVVDQLLSLYTHVVNENRTILV